MKYFLLILITCFTPVTVFLYGEDNINIVLAGSVQAGNVASAQEALKNGADINFIDEDWPLFITAVTSNDVPMVGFFLKNGVNTELKGPDGKTALMHALSLRNSSITEMLINAGANLKAVDPAKKNILMYAAEGNNPKVLKKLLDNGFNRSLKSTADKTALDYAIEARAVDCSRILSRLDSLPMDFLEAVMKGDESLCRKLLADGASPSTKDKNGKAVIVLAIELGYDRIVRMLLENGVDPNATHFKKKDLSLFIFAMHNGKYLCALELLKKGADTNFNYKYNNGKTALMLAVIEKQTSLINLLLEKKFSPDITDDFGNTALMFAAENNLFSVVSALLEKGADPTIRQVDGKTASDIAKAKGHYQIIKLLSEAGKKWI
ncbi:MAG TPA: ankyrin repeat domain-containing protein [bacterium]|nr:ankyrin repeat domain-containing protein [bacterium]HPS29746.1 ankyrin repeat domain-containing protein [bacterium]